MSGGAKVSPAGATLARSAHTVVLDATGKVVTFQDVDGKG